MDAEERENVFNWFRTGYNWLPPLETNPSAVGSNTASGNSPVWETIEQLLRQVDNSHTNNEPNLHWSIARRLELLIKDTENPTEKARIYLEWGVIETQTGDHRDGLMKLRSALELYAGKPEEHAILLFLIGCVEWLIPEQTNQAISSLGKAVKEFNLVQKRYNTIDKKVRAYQEHEGNAKNILRSLINEERFPPCPYVTSDNWAGRNVNTAGAGNGDGGNSFGGTAGSGSEPDDPIYWDSLRVWSVSERIPAGGFGPTGVDPYPIGEVYIPIVTINDEVYGIRNLEPGSRYFDLRSVNAYSVVKITGDSMNQARPYALLEGDFVLVRLQDDARHMDIVLVARRDEETMATIKRYYFSDGIRALRPESSNSIYTPIFMDARKEYKIIGVAVAVFKKTRR